MNIEEIVDDFIEVCVLAKVNLEREDIQINTLDAGETHKPTKLPVGYMAVYIFFDYSCNSCYKVGKVGPNSNARYQTHHYDPSSSISNLSKSLLNDSDLAEKLDLQSDVGQWIKKNTTRINLLVSADKGVSILTLLESFIQCRLTPKYEGFKNQRK